MTPSTVFTLDGNDYSIGVMDAFTQFHVARRVAPAMQALGLSILELTELGKELQNDTAMLAMSKPVLDVISKMSNEDVDYVLKACMKVVSRRPSGAEAPWQTVMNGGNLQFADILMPQMIQITMNVLKERLGGFFGPLLGGQQLGTNS